MTYPHNMTLLLYGWAAQTRTDGGYPHPNPHQTNCDRGTETRYMGYSTLLMHYLPFFIPFDIHPLLSDHDEGIWGS